MVNIQQEEKEKTGKRCANSVNCKTFQSPKPNLSNPDEPKQQTMTTMKQ